jgi:hypothetical protein
MPIITLFLPKEADLEATMLEKAILGIIWSFGLAFGFFGDSCEIRENPFSKKGWFSLL